MFQVGSRIHRIAFQHQVARIFQPYLVPDWVTGDRKPASDKDSGEHSIWASPYPVAEVHSSSLLQATCALDQDLSYGGQLSASHSQTILQDRTTILGKRSAQSNVAGQAIAVTTSQKEISARRWSVVAAEVQVATGRIVHFLILAVP